MNLKKMKIVVLFVVLLYICFNSLQSVQAVTNITVKDAGKAVSDYLKSFYEQYANYTVITSNAKYRYTMYQGKKYASGISKNGKKFENKFAMDQLSLVSFAYHNALGIGDSKTYSNFVFNSGKKFTNVRSTYLSFAVGKISSTKNLSDDEKKKLQPGDILFSTESMNHVAIYVGDNEIIHIKNSELKQESIENYQPGFVAVARIRESALSKISSLSNTFVEGGSLTGQTSSSNSGSSSGSTKKDNTTSSKPNNSVSDEDFDYKSLNLPIYLDGDCYISKEDFVSSIQNYSPGGADEKTGWAEVFVPNAEAIYDQCVDADINPVLCVVQAVQESGYATSEIARGKKNYWGIAASDAGAGAYSNATGFASVSAAVNGYINSISRYKEGGTKYQYMINYANVYQEYFDDFDPDNVNNPYSLYSVWAPIYTLPGGGSPFLHNTSFNNGTYKTTILNGKGYIVDTGYLTSPCTHADSAPISEEEGAAYAMWCGDKLKKIAYQIFGEDGLTDGTGKKKTKRLVDVNEELPLYKHILLTEKYNFNKISWMQYGHERDGVESPMKANKSLGLRYPSDGNNTKLETFVKLVEPFLQTWYIPLSVASTALNKKDVENDDKSLQKDRSSDAISGTTTRDVYFPYTVIQKAYHEIIVNRYDVETFTLNTEYEVYDRYAYHTEYEVTISEKEDDLDRFVYGDNDKISEKVVKISKGSYEVEDGKVAQVNTRMNDSGVEDPMLETEVSREKKIDTKYYISKAETFDLKFYYKWNYNKYSDSDANNRKNEMSGSKSGVEFERWKNEDKKKEMATENLPGYDIERIKSEYDSSVVSASTSVKDGIKTTVYKMRRNGFYYKESGTKYYVSRTWYDTLSYDGDNSYHSYYTIKDLIRFNTSRKSSRNNDDSNSTVEGEYDVRYEEGNLPKITDRKELIDIFVKANSSNGNKMNLDNYDAPTLETIKNTPKSTNGISNENKLNHLKYIADALLEAQEKYNVNALLVMAVSEIESNVGEDASDRLVGEYDTWDWLSMEQANSMYGAFKDSESLTEGFAGHYPYSGHNWIKYTDPKYCVFDFAHYVKYKYINNQKYNVANLVAFCSEASWLTNIQSKLKAYCDAAGVDVESTKEKVSVKQNTTSSGNKNTQISTTDTSADFMKNVGKLTALHEASNNPAIIGGDGRLAFGKYQYHATAGCLTDYIKYAYKNDPNTFSAWKDYIKYDKNTISSVIGNFRSAWTIPYDKDPETFEIMQDKYAAEYIYPQVASLFKTLTGENLDDKKDAIKAMMFTASIRVGAYVKSVGEVFSLGGYQKGMSDSELIEVVYNGLSAKHPREASRYVQEKSECIQWLATGQFSVNPGTTNDVASTAFEEGLKKSKNDYNTYLSLEKKQELNLIDFINANPNIYSKYLREDENVSSYMGYSTARLRNNYYSEIKRIIRKFKDKIYEKYQINTLPFAYFASLGFDVDDFDVEDIQSPSYDDGNGFGWPVDLTDNEGSRVINCIFPPTTAYGGGHGAIDIGKGSGANNIIAAKAGTVVFAEGKYKVGNANDGGGYGNSIVIDHGDGYYTRYSHLSSVNVKVGDTVTKGQKIGVMGSTGNSTGTHLDFTIYHDIDGCGTYKFDERVDPLNFYNTDPAYGSILPSTITTLPSGYKFASEKTTSYGRGDKSWTSDEYYEDYSTTDDDSKYYRSWMYQGKSWKGFPLYSQNDYSDTIPYGSGNMLKNGCGPTALAILLSGWHVVIPGYDTNNDGIMSPLEVARFAEAVGAVSVGTDSRKMIEGLANCLGNDLSYQAYDVGGNSAFDILYDGLNSGNYTCALVNVNGPPFSQEGHIVAAIGVGQNGGINIINSSTYSLMLGGNTGRSVETQLNLRDKAREFSRNEIVGAKIYRVILLNFKEGKKKIKS